jgi:hypothetical protein
MAFSFSDQPLPFNDLTGQRQLTLKRILYRTASVAPASIGATSSLETAVTLRDVAPGDIVVVGVPASLETGLVFSGVRVSAADTVQLRLTNVTAGAIAGAARTWEFLIFKLT